MGRALVWILLALALPATALAGDRITLPADHPYGNLKPGPNAELTGNKCVFCHSTDYVVMQPRGDAKQWQAVVTKMIKVYGAPISEDEAKAIVEYLASSYGPGQ